MGLHKGQINSGSFKKGQVAWNQGLTKEIDERVKKYGIAESKTKRALFKAGKLSGSFKGKHHSKKTKEKISSKIKIDMKRMRGKTYEQIFGKERAKEIIEQIVETRMKNGSYKCSEKNKIRQRNLRLTQKFPKKDTKIEIIIQNKLKSNKILFETHKPIICCQPDIFIQPNLCIFCDGDWWHGNPSIYDQKNLHDIQIRNKWYDIRNTKILKKKGYEVIRLWESDINKNLYKCYKKVNKFLIKLRLE